MSELKSASRIGVDIGGTFTDVVLEHDGTLTTAKVLTTPSAPDEAVLAGVDDVLARTGVDPAAVELLIHGTTLATNAIIERKGALTALVTTEGFRDVLDIGYESRYDQYDIMIEKPPALVPRERRLVVPERVRRARPGPDAPGRSGGREGGRRARAARGRERRHRLPPQLRQPRPRAPGERDHRRRATRNPDHALERSVPRGPRVRAVLHHRRETPTCNRSCRATSGACAPGSRRGASPARCCS